MSSRLSDSLVCPCEVCSFFLTMVSAKTQVATNMFREIEVGITVVSLAYSRSMLLFQLLHTGIY